MNFFFFLLLSLFFFFSSSIPPPTSHYSFFVWFCLHRDNFAGNSEWNENYCTVCVVFCYVDANRQRVSGNFRTFLEHLLSCRHRRHARKSQKCRNVRVSANTREPISQFSSFDKLFDLNACCCYCRCCSGVRQCEQKKQSTVFVWCGS